MIWNWKKLKQFFKKFLPKKKGGRPSSWPTRDEMAQLKPFDAMGLKSIIEVATPEDAHKALLALENETVVGFDTESKPTFVKGEVSKGPHVVQFSTLERAYIFMLHNPETRRAAASLIALQSLKKVGFGLLDDLRFIRARLHASPNSVLDLQTRYAEQGYGKGVGVKVGIAIAFNRRFHKSRRASTSNWGRKRLTEEQLIYAANDAYAAIRAYYWLEDH